MKKDYVNFLQYYDQMSKDDLLELYNKYRRLVNSRIRNIEKSGKFEKTLKSREKRIRKYLTDNDRLKSAPKDITRGQLKSRLLDIGDFLNMQTTTLRGLELRERRIRRALEKSGLKADNIDKWADFLESETYKSLEEKYASTDLFEEFLKVQNEGLTIEQIEDAYKKWDKETRPIPLDDIVRKYIKI